MIVIQAEMDGMGNITARPVSDVWAKLFCRTAAKNGGAAFAVWKSDGFAAFMQNGNAAKEFLADRTAVQRRDLRAGWAVRFKADPWVVGHWYGYDAHTVAEGW